MLLMKRYGTIQVSESAKRNPLAYEYEKYLYFDYEKVGSTQTLEGHVIYDDTLRFTIGEGGSSFTGLIDEVRISDCVLAPAQFLHFEKKFGLVIFVR